MKKLLIPSLKILSFFAWVIFDQVMRAITSPKSIITAESMNNRQWHRREDINEQNAQHLNEALKEL
jgi:hypothetical protein